MAYVPGCDDDPGTWMQRPVCLSTLSKDAHGEIRDGEVRLEECFKPECRTLLSIDTMRMDVARAGCDSTLASSFDGTLVVKRLVHQLENDSTGRGRHTGDFMWSGSGLRASGRISGVTNAGVMRSPLPRECEECQAPGTLRGRLCGVVTEADDATLVECEVFATYLLVVPDLGSEGIRQVLGTIEGVVACPCTAGPG